MKPLHNELTVMQLMSISLTPLRRWIRRQVLIAKVNREYSNLEHFKWQMKNGMAGQKDSQYRIAHMESEIRSLR
ncbi:MAG TPA: hypothetical protein VGU61_19755 [Noviherbaspirillum sp.]|jgi:hypothetical protein|uniref:hypothetical protein n=1 Tax=Noviherbaspirillum sp. TaxID=1926288 RepID=UPI002DDD3E7A|nr:hypothetical protein [Noviherbaspirillum sp.]HEV2612507.1 hypothetical protein [Noviherbaspirillum sp.]